MNIKLLPLKIVCSTICLLSLLPYYGSSQKKTNVEQSEEIFAHWFTALDKAQHSIGITKKDFEIFKSFSEHPLDSLRGDFLKKIGTKITVANVNDYEKSLVKGITNLYTKFIQIKTEYPSSVEEFNPKFHKGFHNTTCDSACTNIDFENGTLSGWNAYYAFNSSTTSSTIISNMTGGAVGAVTVAANDTLTGNLLYTNPTVGLNPQPDYQVKITSGTLHDAIIPSLAQVSPFGGNYSVMLGDSTEVNYGVAVLSQTFLVGPSNANFTYQYAVVLANPSGHNYYQQPLFRIAVLDGAGDTIPYCGEYNVVSGNGTQNFDSMQYSETYPSGGTETFTVFWKDWTKVNVPLTKYMGQCVTVIFEVVDCSLGGHFGYAYIDASCAPLALLTSSANFCGQDSIELYGPAGEQYYYWTGPAGGIRSNDSSQNISVDSAGTYTLVVTPFTGATCRDTLTITIGKIPGPPPHPSFTADTGCAGSTITFPNNSNPLGGATFLWDFYNNGTYEDSNVNGSWIYNTAGTYSVRLHETYNGCSTDTIIRIVIDPAVATAFFADTVCLNDTTKFTNTSTNGLTYFWNFGDPSTGVNNTSTLTNPTHHFDSAGTFLVTLIGNHPGYCGDSVKERVVVLPLPKGTITGVDSICSGSNEVLTASGGTSYLWSTGATTSSITVAPTTKTTYTVQISNGVCNFDTAITVPVKPTISGTLNGTGLVCYGDSIYLTATGGGTYLWNTGATTSSITVPANSTSDTAYSVTISNGGACITLHKTITVDSVIGYACCNTTIYVGDSTIIYGNGGVQYHWIPSIGLSCDTCRDPVASPTVTTVYTLVTTYEDGCSASAIITVNVEFPCKDFFVPNVFTPNGDGNNDTYLIKVEYMSDYRIWIYNRWGRLMFYSTNPDAPWTGDIKDGQASDGIYYYIIKATCMNGTDFEKHGYLQLIR